MFPPHHFSFSENSTGLHWQFSWKAHEPWTALLKSCISAITSLDRADVTGSRHVFSTSTGLCSPTVTWGDTDMRAQLTLGPPTCLHQPNPIQQVLWLKVRLFSAKLLCRRAHSARSVVPGHGLFPSAPLPSCTTIHGSSYLCTAGSWRESQARGCHLAPGNSTG